MYLYKTTNLTNGQYYFGISSGARGSFDPVIESDPEGKFYPGNNGQHPISNTVKTLIMLGDTEEELLEHISRMAKNSETDPNFLGVYGITKKKKVEVIKPVDDIPAQTSSVIDPLIPEVKEKPKMKPIAIREDKKLEDNIKN